MRQLLSKYINYLVYKSNYATVLLYSLTIKKHDLLFYEFPFKFFNRRHRSSWVDSQEDIVVQPMTFLVEMAASVFHCNGSVTISQIVRTGVTKLIARIRHWVCEGTNLSGICPFFTVYKEPY